MRILGSVGPSATHYGPLPVHTSLDPAMRLHQLGKQVAPCFLANNNPELPGATGASTPLPCPFSTPLMPKKVMFADSPLSKPQQLHYVAIGYSPGPFPSWDHTPQLHHAKHKPMGI
jgi:hypothetical protein